MPFYKMSSLSDTDSLKVLQE